MEDILKNVPEVYKEIISDIKEVAENQGVKLNFSNTKTVIAEGETIECNGYFSDEPLELAVAVGKPFDEWFPLFLHESCHMEQFIEDKYIWDKSTFSIQYYFEWLEKTVELSSDRLDECIIGSIELEKDCEQRVIHAIKQFQLPISIIEYIQKANTYLYSYYFCRDKRKWIIGLYTNPRVWKKAPKEFKSSYKKIPKGLYTAMEKHLLKLEKDGTMDISTK